MSLKTEVQSQSGLLSIVREQYTPDAKEMSEKAFREYEKTEKITKEKLINQVDSVLKELIVIENRIFQENQKKIIKDFIPFYIKNKDIKKLNFPKIEKYIKNLEITYNKIKNGEKEFLEDVFSNETFEVTDSLSVSLSQSAKSRAGHSLENHLEKIFDILEFKYSRQCNVLGDEAILDFVMPSKEHFEQNPSKVMNIECQTTLKDRFRLTIAKINKTTSRKFLATATGINIITSKDSKDITVDKLIEIVVNNQITIVVFEETIEPLKKMIKNKIEKETTPEKLSKIKKLDNLFDEKVISYKKLIVKEIPDVVHIWSK